MAITLNPYLAFMGQAKQAMEFYHSVFGGELKVQTYGESGQSDKPEEKDFVMHADLKSDTINFFASDGNSEHQVHPGDNVSLCLGGADEAKLTEIFNKLSEGGKVDLPLEKQFWGDIYGQLTDKFGVHWMVNINSGKQG